MKNRQGVLIFNPKSGKGKATIRARDFADRWKEKFGTELALRATRSLEDIRVAARETYNNRGEIQIFMGGDGTLSESLQGLAEHTGFKPDKYPMGFLPGGTGNSFLRDFDITSYEQARDALLSAIESDSILDIDSGIITYNKIDVSKPAEPGAETRRITFNIWGIGLISDVTVTAIKMRWMGAANYSVAGLFKILSHKPYDFKVTLDGKAEDLTCNMITVSNSRYTGGAMEIAPSVRVNDGKLFFIAPSIKSRFKLLNLFPRIFKGDHVDIPGIRTQFIKEIKLERKRPFVMNIDGELETGFNPRLSIHSNFFRLYMPRELLKQ